MGYGGRALELLQEYYEGKHPSLDESDKKEKKSEGAAKVVKVSRKA